MPNYYLLLPPALLGFSACAMFLLRSWVSRPGRMLILLWALAGALWLTIRLTWGTNQIFVLSPWSQIGLPILPLAIHIQAIGVWISVLALLVATTLLLAHLDEPTEKLRPNLADTVVVLAAVTMLWAMAANLVTLLFAWVLLDAATMFAFGLGRSSSLASRTVVVGQLSTLILLGAAIQFSPAMDPLVQWAGKEFQSVGLWFAFAVALRARIYPFHFNIEREPPAPTFVVGILPFVSSIAGLGLALRLFEMSGSSPFPGWLAGLVCAGLIPLGFLVWTATHPSQSISLLIAYESALGFVALLWNLPVATLSVLLVAGMALPLLLIAPRTAGRLSFKRWPEWLAWASIAGAPVTAGFWVVRPLLRHAVVNNLPLPVVAITIGNLFVVSAAFNYLTDELPIENRGPSSWVAAAFLAVPLLLLGLSPSLLRLLMLASGMAYWTSAPVALSSFQNVALWAALILPLPGGYVLWKSWRNVPLFIKPRIASLRTILNAQWLLRTFDRVFESLGALLRNATGLWEGEHVFLWTLLFAFILILAVLNQ